MAVRKAVAATAAAAVVLGAGLWVTDARAASNPASAGVRYVQAPVKRGEIRATAEGTGPVASVNGVTVKANQAGAVAQILAQDGDHVNAGQVVMLLRNDGLQAALKQAQIDLTADQTALYNLLHPTKTQVEAQRLKVEAARLAVQQRQADVDHLAVKAPVGGMVESVAVPAGSGVKSGDLLVTLFDDHAPQFEVDLPQAAAVAVKPGQLATVEIAGVGTLTGSVLPSARAATPTAGSRDAAVPVTLALPATPGLRPGLAGSVSMTVPGLTYVVEGYGTVAETAVTVQAQVAGTVARLAVQEGDRVGAGALLAQLTGADAVQALAQAQSDLQVQQQALTDLLDPAQDPDGQLRLLQQKLQTDQINLAASQSNVDDLQVKAPVDGVLSSVTERPGDRLTAGAALFHVADYSHMQVTVSVDELAIAQIRPGQKASITLDAQPGKTYTGQVTSINPEGTVKNEIAMFDVTVGIDDPQGLMAGMNSTVEIAVAEKEGLYVPAQAVKVVNGRATVQILKNGAPVTVPIQTGLRTPETVEVTGGLTEGEQVITTTVMPPVTSSTGLRLPGLGGGSLGGGGSFGGGGNRSGGGGGRRGQ